MNAPANRMEKNCEYKAQSSYTLCIMLYKQMSFFFGLPPFLPFSREAAAFFSVFRRAHLYRASKESSAALMCRSRPDPGGGNLSIKSSRHLKVIFVVGGNGGWSLITSPKRRRIDRRRIFYLLSFMVYSNS
jgi:hypothetical protein